MPTVVREFRFALPLLAAGLFAAFHPMFLSGFAEIPTTTTRSVNDPPDDGDPRLVNWFLEHSWRWVTGDPFHSAFWDAPYFHPATNVLAYSESLTASAPPYWLFRAAGLPPDTSFQAWMLLCAGLNYAVFLAFLRIALGFPPFASACGAALFAFGSSRVAQMVHPQLLPQYWLVAAMWGGYEALRTDGTPARRRIGVIAAIACSALQLASSFYWGVFLFALSWLLFWWSLVFVESRRAMFRLLREQAIPIVLTSVVAGAALMPLFLHSREAARQIGIRMWWDALAMLPRLHSYFFLGRDNVLYGFLADIKPFEGTPAIHEHGIGLGLVTMAVAVIGLRRMIRDDRAEDTRKPPARPTYAAVPPAGLWATLRRGVWTRPAAAVTLVLFVFTTMWPGRIPLWPALYFTVPGIQGVRAVSRLAILLLIPAGIGLAAFVRSFRDRPATAQLGLAAMLVICAVEQLHRMPSFDKYEVRRRVAAIVEGIDPKWEAFHHTAAGANSRLLMSIHVDAMWAAIEARVPTLNGYSGSQPRDWHLFRLYDEPGEPGKMDALYRKAMKHWCTKSGLNPDRLGWVWIRYDDRGGPVGVRSAPVRH